MRLVQRWPNGAVAAVPFGLFRGLGIGLRPRSEGSGLMFIRAKVAQDL